MATKQEKQAFQSDVAKAVKDFEKTIQRAKTTIKMAEKSGTAKQLTKAQGFLKDLQDLQPIIDKLKQAKSPTATYKGPITQPLADQLNMDIQNKQMGATARGEYGPTGAGRKVYAKGKNVAGFEGYSPDGYYLSSNGTGISNTGKYYFAGKEVSEQDFYSLVTGKKTNVPQDGVTTDLGKVKTGDVAGTESSDLTIPGAGGVTSVPGSTDLTGTDFNDSTFSGSTPSGSSFTGSLTTSSGNYTISNTGRSTNLTVLKSMLQGMGLNPTIVDSSSSFLLALLKDGLDYDNAVEIYLNSKDYTTKEGKVLNSPFYTEYGYLNEGLIRPKGADEIYNAVEGYKEVQAKYNLNPKFVSKEFIKGYVKNNVSVAKLSENANLARLKAANADAAYVESLKRFGYINEPTDLTDFYLDPTIGEETLNQRRATAAFGAEAIKRAKQGVQFSTERFNQITAGLLGLGLTPEQIQVKAAEGTQNIADILMPTTRLSQIYEKPVMQEEALRSQIQSELESEEYTGLSSERRKRLKELESRAYQGEAGIYRTSALGSSGVAGIL